MFSYLNVYTWRADESPGAGSAAVFSSTDCNGFLQSRPSSFPKCKEENIIN